MATDKKEEEKIKEIPDFPGPAKFLNNAPLYAKFQLTSLNDVKSLYSGNGDSTHPTRFDGHCPFCNKQTTFTFSRANIVGGTQWNADKINKRYSYDECRMTCARNDNHVVYFWLRLFQLQVEKVGQFPSLADIANDDSKRFRKVLSREDAGEFHKAIGLAAHGVGIGSFVYLRRIFERLIQKRFAEHQKENSWNEDEFKRLRMEEKVAFLKEYLPAFLVEHRKIYSILSSGIHELQEEQCLAFFDVLKNSIIIILEDDQKKAEELEQRKRFSAAIKQFAPDESADEGQGSVK